MSNFESLLIARINRRLSRRGEKLHKTRARWVNDLGQYHVIDDRNYYCGPGRLDSIDDLVDYLQDLVVSDSLVPM